MGVTAKERLGPSEGRGRMTDRQTDRHTAPGVHAPRIQGRNVKFWSRGSTFGTSPGHFSGSLAHSEATDRTVIRRPGTGSQCYIGPYLLRRHRGKSSRTGRTTGSQDERPPEG